jgi:hypothetical protein
LIVNAFDLQSQAEVIGIFLISPEQRNSSIPEILTFSLPNACECRHYTHLSKECPPILKQLSVQVWTVGRESVPVRRRSWFAELGPIPGWLKQLQAHGKGITGNGFAINDMCTGMEMAGEGSNGDVLIGRPAALR